MLRFRTILFLISLVQVQALLFAAPSTTMEKDCQVIETSAQATKDLSFLDTEVDPAYDHRIYRSRQMKNAAGNYAFALDTTTLLGLSTELKIDNDTTSLLARFIINRDELSQARGELGQIQTRCFLAYEQSASDPQQQALLVSHKKGLTESSLRVDAITSDAMKAYHSLEQHLGPEKTQQLFRTIAKRSEDEFANVSTQLRAKRMSDRKKAAERCERGLQECRFPEGLPINCSGYLKMSAEQILQKCPHPGRYGPKDY
jgi:hypothetical protein